MYTEIDEEQFNMSIKLIALDMDGTLLNSHGKILTSTKEAVKKALDRGIKVVLCSGRPIAGLQHYMDELGIEGSAEYVVTLNGAITRDADDDIITKDLVPNSLYRKMAAFAIEHKIPFNIVDADSRIITADHNINPIVYLQAYENKATLYVRNPEEIPDDLEIAKGCFVSDSDLLDQWEDKIRKVFGKDLNVVRDDKNFLELLNPRVSKGNGLKELCQNINISPNEVMAVGDERNDISMFAFAGTAVCMDNGSAEAKKHADFITSSNDEDGISKAFNKFIF